MEQEFIAAFELAMARPTDENRKLCALAASNFMMANRRGIQRSRIAPCLAAQLTYVGNRRRLGVLGTVFSWLLLSVVLYCRQVKYRNLPMWNDFEISRWLLTHDAKYIPLIYRQIHKRSKDDMVRLTGHWMVRSNIEQHADFAEQWRARYPDCPDGCAVQIQQNVAGLPDEIRQRAETIL